MKQTIKKSIIGGITFFSTVMLLFVVYATFTFDQPDSVGTGSGLTATNWNKMVNSVGYLKSTLDGVQTQVTNLSSAGGCPSGYTFIAYGNTFQCIKDGTSIIGSRSSSPYYVNGYARINGGLVQTRTTLNNIYGACDSGRINGLNSTCSNSNTTAISLSDTNGVCVRYSTSPTSKYCSAR